ncbi:MAG: hypothetical protein ACWGPS_08705 [Candidatus Promineifilaceae bacterium]
MASRQKGSKGKANQEPKRLPEHDIKKSEGQLEPAEAADAYKRAVASPPPPLNPQDLMALQRSVGNLAVQRLLDERQQRPALEGSHFVPGVQRVGEDRPTWRTARRGETYHRYKSGWYDRDLATSLEREVTPSVVSNFRTIISSSEVSRMLLRFGSGLEIVLHVVQQIHVVNPLTGNLDRTEHRGEALRAGQLSRAPSNEVHIAVRESIAAQPGALRRTLTHELFHTAVAAPGAGPSAGGRRPRGALAFHPRDLMGQVVNTRRGLARRLAWPAAWDHPYRFGWFHHPVLNVDLHIDDEPTFHRHVRQAVGTAANAAHRRLFTELIRIKSGRLYESAPPGACFENPEEDMADSFQLYMNNREHLRSTFPMRYRLLHAYFYTGR